MHKSSLIELIRTFSKQEIKDFGEFVQSPFFNKNKGVTKLYQLIRKHHPEFSEEKIKKEILFKKIFEGEKYNDPLMRLTIFRLSKLAEDYISYMSFISSGAETRKFLLSELLVRNVDKLFMKKYKEATEELEGPGMISPDYFGNKFNIEAIYFNYLTTRGINDKHYYDVVKGASELLLSYFLNEAEPIFNSLRQSKGSRIEDNTFNILPEFFRNFNSEQFFEKFPEEETRLHVVIKLNYYLVRCITDARDEESYLKAKEIFYGNTGLFTKEERFRKFTIIANFLLAAMRMDDRFQREFFELLIQMLATKTYNVYGDTMDFHLYDNILNTAINLGEIQWAEDFVEKYIVNIIPASRANTLSFSKARIALEKSDYDSALKYMGRVIPEFFIQKLRLRIMHIRINYERGEFDSALSALDTFRHFLNKAERLSEDKRTTHEKFIKITTQLIKLRSNPNLVKLDELKDRLSKPPLAAAKNWLEAKAAELEKEISS